MPNIDESAKRWQEDLAVRTGQAIAEMRTRRRLTAVDLANRTRELGYPISRVAISKIENGTRAGKLDVAEIIVLARALNVAPVQLIYPNLPDGPVEVLPGTVVRAREALLWASGEQNLPATVRPGLSDEERREIIRSSGEWSINTRPVAATREYVTAKTKLRQAEQALQFALERAEKGYTAGLDARRDLVNSAESRLRRAEQQLQELGLPFEPSDD